MIREKIVKTIELDKRFKKEVELVRDIIYSIWVDDFNCIGNTSLSEITERLKIKRG